MYEVVTDLTPYPALENGELITFRFLNLVVYNDLRPEFKFPVKPEIRELILRCWSKNPNDRPTFKEIFNKLAYDKNYYLDDVESEVVEDYIDEITRVNDPVEELLKVKETLEKENQELKEENEKLKNENQELKNPKQEDVKALSLNTNGTFQLLDDDMIKQLLKIKKFIENGSTCSIYKNPNYITFKGTLCLKVLNYSRYRLKPQPNNFWSEEEEIMEEIKDEESEVNYNGRHHLLNEFELLIYLNHPNILKAYGTYFGRQANPAILLEYCRYNLKEAINHLENADLVCVVYEICSAMKYLHENKIIHRDLNPNNILLNKKKHVKICDFGLARSIDDTSLLTSGIGTMHYMAPEIVFENEHYNEKVDVYSFGVVMHFILSKGNLKYPKLINE